MKDIVKHIFIAVSIVCVITVSGLVAAKYKPHVYPYECVGCGDCVEVCPKKGKAIHLVRGKAVINVEECIGCGRCIYICSFGAVR